MQKIYNANRSNQSTIMGEKIYYAMLVKRGEEGEERKDEGRERQGRGRNKRERGGTGRGGKGGAEQKESGRGGEAVLDGDQ